MELTEDMKLYPNLEQEPKLSHARSMILPPTQPIPPGNSEYDERWTRPYPPVEEPWS